MLDYRHETFLMVYRLRSYTKAARALNLTQPAVSQHIKALESRYGCSLFTYARKTLIPTEQGRLLYRFASKMAADSNLLEQKLRQKGAGGPPLRFGATLTIGQYILPAVVAEVLEARPTLALTMLVENTQQLLDKLEQGEIQFALIEGLFDKSAYHFELFALEPFVGICAATSPLAGAQVRLEDLISHRLIVRERGSGTREILEQLLQAGNLSLESFPQLTEIGSLEAIKQLVQGGAGITFLHEVAARKELVGGQLARLEISGLKVRRELNFVFLKDSQHTDDYLHWFHIFREGYARAFGRG